MCIALRYKVAFGEQAIVIATNRSEFCVANSITIIAAICAQGRAALASPPREKERP